MKKIAFITACKGRLHHLRQTLPQNISNNIEYPNCKFYILDYNSKDGLEDWINRYMIDFINSGKLVYLKNKDAMFFRFAHSRNQLIRCVDADTDIICNVDADNFTGYNFAYYLNANIIKPTKKEIPKFYSGTIFDGNSHTPIAYTDRLVGCFGRIATWREAFVYLRGYDEIYKDWGFEDNDMYLRLMKLKFKHQTINEKYLNSIDHSDKERVKNTENNKIKEIKDNFYSYMDKSIAYTHNNPIVRNPDGWGQGIIYKNFNEKLNIK